MPYRHLELGRDARDTEFSSARQLRYFASLERHLVMANLAVSDA